MNLLARHYYCSILGFALIFLFTGVVLNYRQEIFNSILTSVSYYIILKDDILFHNGIVTHCYVMQ